MEGAGSGSPPCVCDEVGYGSVRRARSAVFSALAGGIVHAFGLIEATTHRRHPQTKIHDSMSVPRPLRSTSKLLQYLRANCQETFLVVLISAAAFP